jgi:hypothetical protein
MTTKLTACQHLSGPNGATAWLMIVGIATAMFLAARAVDTYRHRLARDRQLAAEYRNAMRSRGGLA